MKTKDFLCYNMNDYRTKAHIPCRGNDRRQKLCDTRSDDSWTGLRSALETCIRTADAKSGAGNGDADEKSCGGYRWCSIFHCSVLCADAGAFCGHTCDHDGGGLVDCAQADLSYECIDRAGESIFLK